MSTTSDVPTVMPHTIEFNVVGSYYSCMLYIVLIDMSATSVMTTMTPFNHNAIHHNKYESHELYLSHSMSSMT